MYINLFTISIENVYTEFLRTSRMRPEAYFVFSVSVFDFILFVVNHQYIPAISKSCSIALGECSPLAGLGAARAGV